jgi:hypothetical protein
VVGCDVEIVLESTSIIGVGEVGGDGGSAEVVSLRCLASEEGWCSGAEVDEEGDKNEQNAGNGGHLG